MNFNIIENENYFPLSELVPFGGMLFIVFGAVIAYSNFLEARHRATPKTRFTNLWNIMGYVTSVVIFTIGITAVVNSVQEPVSRYDVKQTLSNVQEEIKTVYGLDLTTDEVNSLLPHFWSSIEWNKDEKFTQYREITTLNSKNQISTIRLVQIKGEYQLVYADKNPVKLEEIERKN